MDQMVLISFSHFTFASAFIFLHQLIINIFVLRQGVLASRGLKFHLGLCLCSLIYSVISFLLVQEPSQENGLLLLTIGWVVGSLCAYYYIFAMKYFLGDDSPGLTLVGKLPLVSALGAAVALLLHQFGALNLLTDPVAPTKSFQNIIMASVGGHNPHQYLKTLSLFIVGPTLYSLVYFVRFMRRRRRGDFVLGLGIALSFLVFFNDVALSILDFAYIVPLMFISNIFETLRITYVNQREIGLKLASLEQELTRSRRFSDAGLYYSTLAHEISNPLNAARGYLDLLTKKTESILPQKLQNYLVLIDRQHERALKLVKGVKRFTKPGAGEMAVVELASLIEDSFETLEIKLRYANVSVEVSPASENQLLRCHPDQLIQVFTNFINNAIEANLDVAGPWIRISWETAGKDAVRIKFTDSGPGIPPELRDQIWVSGFTTKKQTGNGLGLSICRSIIHEHGGEISLNLESAQTEFFIDLPTAQI